MKSTVYLLLAAELLLPAAADACGPFNPIIPTPPYFVINSEIEPDDPDRLENLRLWQSQTSPQIPLGDIEQTVYRDSCDYFNEMTDLEDKKPTQNLMYTYLRNCGSTEAIEFLALAKGIEETRRDDIRRSPWYYPAERYGEYSDANLDFFIQEAMNYDGEIFRERYAMQACRALFSSNQYARCIEYYDSIFSEIDNSSLMKRMAGDYAGGSWIHLGDTVKANLLFARAGDINSLTVENPLEYLLEKNPDAPQLMYHLRSHIAVDSALMAETLPLALKAIGKKEVTNKGDWGFYLAYFYNHFAHDPVAAKRYLQKAIRQKFSSEDLKNQALAYKMKLDGCPGKENAILSNLRWLDEHCRPTNRDGKAWNRRRRNIIYADWIPQLWNRGDYATAILLADYADSRNTADFYREEEVAPGDMDRGSLTFQLMGSLRSDQLAAAMKKIMSPSPLHNYLRQDDLLNPDMYNELIGSLALREGNYARAISYLTKVSTDYQRSMRLHRQGYLGHDPFTYYPERWEKNEWDDYVWYFDNNQAATPRESPDNAKLQFARQMLDYQRRMKSAPTADERAMARLKYALGRRNSFEQCWALTQYWRGFIEWRFLPNLEHWSSEFYETNYGFLYEYTPEMAQETERIFNREVEKALQQMKSDETRAQAEYLLCNLLTIAKKYPHTQIAERLKTSCDNWKNWL